MSDPRQHIEAQLEAQRFQAQQAARDVAQLDVRAVLIAVQVKIEAGEIEAAKAIVAQWKAGQR